MTCWTATHPHLRPPPNFRPVLTLLQGLILLCVCRSMCLNVRVGGEGRGVLTEVLGGWLELLRLSVPAGSSSPMTHTHTHAHAPHFHKSTMSHIPLTQPHFHFRFCHQYLSQHPQHRNFCLSLSAFHFSFCLPFCHSFCLLPSLTYLLLSLLMF